MSNEEKELLRGQLTGFLSKPTIILTNKRIIAPDENIMLSDVVEAYARCGGFSGLSKLVLRLKDGSLKEFSLAVSKENRSNSRIALNILSGWDSLIVSDTSDASKTTVDRWVNLINRVLAATPIS